MKLSVAFICFNQGKKTFKCFVSVSIDFEAIEIWWNPLKVAWDGTTNTGIWEFAMIAKVLEPNELEKKPELP